MHTGSQEEVTLLEVTELEGEVPAPQEAPAQEVVLEGVEVDLPVCQDHQAATFLKGKPRSILNLPCFTNLI